MARKLIRKIGKKFNPPPLEGGGGPKNFFEKNEKCLKSSEMARKLIKKSEKNLPPLLEGGGVKNFFWKKWKVSKIIWNGEKIDQKIRKFFCPPPPQKKKIIYISFLYMTILIIFIFFKKNCPTSKFLFDKIQQKFFSFWSLPILPIWGEFGENDSVGDHDYVPSQRCSVWTWYQTDRKVQSELC